MPRWVRWMGRALGLVLVLVLLAGGAAAWMSEPVPEGIAGDEAEALADALLAAVDEAAWARTGAVAWTFAGRNHHLWDRERMLSGVQWGDVRVLVDLTAVDGRAWRADEEVFGERRRALIDDAYARWVNDSFWLNPVVKLRDPGTERLLVQQAGEQALLVRYTSGGLTPGDAYLWLPGAEQRPRAWRLWVSVVPIGGLEASWDGWTQLGTGAWVSTVHRFGPFELTLSDVAGAEDVQELTGRDPFDALRDGGH